MFPMFHRYDVNYRINVTYDHSVVYLNIFFISSKNRFLIEYESSFLFFTYVECTCIMVFYSVLIPFYVQIKRIHNHKQAS